MNADRPLRLAVLGVGRIGSMHADLLQHQVAPAHVTAVYDVATEFAAATAARLGCDAAASVSEIMASDDIDAVVIASSTDTHVDLIVAAAEAGKAIFCEKPVSLSLEEVDRGLAAVDAAGVPLHIGFNRRFDPGHRAVRQAVVDGTLGDLRQVRITSRDPEPPPIAYVEVSGGIFNDMTIHDFDMARYVTGHDVTRVYAQGSVTVDPAIGAAGDLDTVSVMLTHDDGTITMIDNCRQAAYGYDQRVEAFGSGGMSVSENQADHYAVTRTGDGGRIARVPHFFLQRYIPSYLAQWEQFVTAVRNGTPTPVSGADGRAPLVLALAARKSVDEGRPVGTDEIG